MNILPGQPLAPAAPPASAAGPQPEVRHEVPAQHHVVPASPDVSRSASPSDDYAFVAAPVRPSQAATSPATAARPPRATRWAHPGGQFGSDGLLWGIAGASLWLLSTALPWWIVNGQVDSARSVGDPFSVSSKGASLGFGKWAITAGLAVLVLLVAHRMLGWPRRWASLTAGALLLVGLCWHWWPSEREDVPGTLDTGNAVLDSLGITTRITNDPGVGMWLALASACLIAGGATLAALSPKQA
jgi:hypothetical protein